MAFDHLANITGQPLRVLITLAASCGFLLFGYDNGVFSGLIVSSWFLKTFHHPDAGLLGTVSAMYNIGGFLGSLVAFFLGSKLGRRRMILGGIAITTIGVVLQCIATNIGELLTGRTITGLGVGAMTSTVGLWQAETVPAKSRGLYLTFQLLGGAGLGLFCAQWINFGLRNRSDRVAFVFPLAFQMVFVVTSGFLVACLPESPRWLVKRGRKQEAEVILTRLQGQELAAIHLAQIVEADALEHHIEGNEYRQLFAGGATQNFRRLCLACGVMIMHQLNGINSVTYYMPTLLQKFIGASHTTALWVSGLTSVCSMLCATIPVLCIDRFGRRPFLWGGAIWQVVTFAILAALPATAPAAGSKSHGIAAVVMVFLYYGGNAATWLGPSWAYPAEVLPLQIREKGLALGNVFYWLFQFMIVEVTPIALTNIGYKFYVILAIFNTCSALIVYFCFPETKQLSLEEIDFMFARKYGHADELVELEKSGASLPAKGSVAVEWVEDKATA